MLKQIIAVAFLSSFALGQYNPFDRQWADDDPRQICEEKCVIDCENCTEPVRCVVGEENECGQKPINPLMPICSTDDICVPENCKCDTFDVDGNLCVRICSVNCTEDQIQCEVKDINGCEQNDICVHKGFDIHMELCEGFCPVECEDDQLKCSQPNTESGCKVAEICVDKQIDHMENICSFQQCPLTCEETHHKCEGGVDEDGCKEEDTCVARQLSHEGELCPGVCPVTCGPGEILCEGTIEYGDTIYRGCKGQDVCHVKEKDDNEVYCPENSASHGCDVVCPPDEVLCPPSAGPLGCLGPLECKKRSLDNNGTYCPSTADCPTHCSTNEYNCATGEDEKGCRLPDECVSKKRDFQGDLCPFHCPEVCNDEQLFCGGRIDETGCQGPSSCRNKDVHKWGPGAEEDPKAECPGYCLAQCLSHEILCPSQLDPCNGCPTEEVCREAIKDKNGIFCPGKEEAGQPSLPTSNRRGGHLSYSHNCPKLCKEEEGEVLCPQYEDESGCKPEAECFGRTHNDDGDWCPAHSTCNKQCPKGFLLCLYDGDYDATGCKLEPSCVYKGKNKSDLYCPGNCPPICSKGETLTSYGQDDYGCELAPFCLPEGEGSGEGSGDGSGGGFFA